MASIYVAVSICFELIECPCMKIALKLYILQQAFLLDKNTRAYYINDLIIIINAMQV